MKTFPSWRFPFVASNDELTKDYWWVNKEIGVLEWFGFQAGPYVSSGAAATGGAQAVLKAGRQGLRAGASTFVRGAVKNEVVGISGGFRGGYAATWIMGKYLVTQATKYRAMMKTEIQRRYQEDKMKVGEYQKALGDDEPLPARYLYKFGR